MIREMTLDKYPREVRLTIRLASRFLSSIDVPGPRRPGHLRFARALRRGLSKLEDTLRHKDLPEPEWWALRIAVNFAIDQVQQASLGLGRFRDELRAAAKARRRQPRSRRVRAG